MVYITQSNAASIVYKTDRTMIGQLDGAVYNRPIYMLSTSEKRTLRAIRKFFKDPEWFIEYYFGKTRGRNDDDLVFEASSSPAYHANSECERLHSEFKNYEIPKEIIEKAESEQGIKIRFRQWFKANCHLLDEDDPRYQPDYFILRIRGEFKVDIRDIREIVRPNSGITDMKNASLDEIQGEIGRILRDAGKCYYASDKNTAILRAYQKRSYFGLKEPTASRE